MFKSKLIIKFISLMVILTFYSSIKGQNSFKLKGQILSPTEKPIAFAHIVSNSSKEKGSLSGKDGFFEIDTYIGDTLLISYIGYRPIKFFLKTKNNIVIKMAILTENLPEFVIKPHNQKNNLTTTKIIKNVINQWESNYIVFKNNYLINLDVDFSIKEDDKEIYTYKGNINLNLIKGNIYSNKFDVNKKKQKKQLHNEVLKVTGGNPYNIIQQLGYSIIKNKDFNFSFGNITQYKNINVYHINFHKKEGRKLCESGGFYLISKKDFVVLYAESNIKTCDIYQDESVNISWDYFKIKYNFKKNKYSKYSISKIESESQYSIIQNDKISTFHQIEYLQVKNMERKMIEYFDLNDLTLSRIVFYTDEK